MHAPIARTADYVLFINTSINRHTNRDSNSIILTSESHEYEHT